KSPMINDQLRDPRKARLPKRQSTDIPPAINEGPPGFYGMLTREKAEYMLSNKPHGTYIVRECETRKGEFTVSVKKDKEVSHVIISNASQDNLQGPLDVQLTRITNELGCTPVAYGDDRHIYDVSPGLSEIDTISWFYEKLTADEGTKILQHHPMGTYLLRECRSSKGNFTLMWSRAISRRYLHRL
uniref:SH2 domain-containing protein n=1 Tax=Clytia hemisphaerica TaxID=252671 RepID=A0A7M5UZX8_9CNID